MRGEGEAAPLLRGRPEGGQQGVGPSPQQPAGVRQDSDHAGDRNRFVSRRLPSALLSRARSHPLLLAVAAVGAAVLVIGAGMRSASEKGVGRGGGDVSLSAAPGSTREEGSGGNAGAAAALDLGGRRDGGVVVGGIGERGGGRGGSSGGWRSQAERGQGTSQYFMFLVSGRCAEKTSKHA